MTEPWPRAKTCGPGPASPGGDSEEASWRPHPKFGTHGRIRVYPHPAGHRAVCLYRDWDGVTRQVQRQAKTRGAAERALAVALRDRGRADAAPRSPRTPSSPSSPRSGSASSRARARRSCRPTAIGSTVRSSVASFLVRSELGSQYRALGHGICVCTDIYRGDGRCSPVVPSTRRGPCPPPGRRRP
jgi:hypothetical protein